MCKPIRNNSITDRKAVWNCPSGMPYGLVVLYIDLPPCAMCQNPIELLLFSLLLLSKIPQQAQGFLQLIHNTIYLRCLITLPDAELCPAFYGEIV